MLKTTNAGRIASGTRVRTWTGETGTVRYAADHDYYGVLCDGENVTHEWTRQQLTVIDPTDDLVSYTAGDDGAYRTAEEHAAHRAGLDAQRAKFDADIAAWGSS